MTSPTTARISPNERLGVGIVGLSAERGWGAIAHLPALRALDGFEVRGLSASTAESARRSADAHGIAFATADPAELAGRSDIDLIVIAVAVPQHDQLVRATVEAGKLLFCEWPLARTTAEAAGMAALAGGALPASAVGLQARSTPEVRHARDLVEEGALGHILSVTLVGAATNWGDTTLAPYLVDYDAGATLIRIPFAHTLDGVQSIVGDLGDVVAKAAIVQPNATLEGTGAPVTKTAHDQIVVGGTLPGGGVLAAHYRGGQFSTNFLLEINGTRGDLTFTGPSGHLQFGEATLHRASPGQAPIPVQVPAQYRDAIPPQLRSGGPASVAHAYVQWRADLHDGGSRVPDFAAAVRLHEQLDTIERAAGISTAAID